VSGTSDGGAGSFAEESARLLAAFQEWAARGRTAAHDLAEGGEAPHGPECGICPICQGIALVRGLKPEVVDHLTDAMTSLAAAVSELLRPDGEPPARRTHEKVQHIDVTDDGVADAG
jgi:hypothetical protein